MPTTSSGRTLITPFRYKKPSPPSTIINGKKNNRTKGTRTKGTTTTTAAPTTQPTVPAAPTARRAQRQKASQAAKRQQGFWTRRHQYPLDKKISGDEITNGLEDLMANIGSNLNISGNLAGQGVNVPDLRDMSTVLEGIHTAFLRQYKGDISIRAITTFGMKAVQKAVLEKYTQLVDTIGGYYYAKIPDDDKDKRRAFFESPEFLNKLCNNFDSEELTVLIEGLFKTSYRKKTPPGDRLAKSDARSLAEHSRPDSQCNKVIAIKSSPELLYGKLTCYLCSQIMNVNTQQLQCEHILPVLFAVCNLGLSDGGRAYLTQEALNILKYEYLWSHAACNMWGKNDILIVKIGDTKSHTLVWVPHKDNIKKIVDQILNGRNSPNPNKIWQEIQPITQEMYDESKQTILDIASKLCKILNDGEANWCKAFTDDAIIKRALCDLVGKYKFISKLGTDIDKLVAGFNRQGDFMSIVPGGGSPVGAEEDIYKGTTPGYKGTTTKTRHKDTTTETKHNVTIDKPQREVTKTKLINQENIMEDMWQNTLKAFEEIKKGDFSLEEKDVGNIIQLGIELINDLDLNNIKDIDKIMDIDKINIDEIINYDENKDMDSILYIHKHDGGKYTKTKKNKKRKKSKKTRRKKSKR